MLKLASYLLAAIAVLFSLAAYGADPVSDKSEAQPAPQSTPDESPAAAVANDAAVAEEIASNPGKFVKAAIQADNMGYLYAVVYNPSNVVVANVHVIVVHIDTVTRQPDNQSVPLLVASRLAPGERGQLKLEGLQVYKQVDLKAYRVLVAGAEVGK